MSEYAADALRGWIKAGMPYTGRVHKDKCAVCGNYERTHTGNFTYCCDGSRHQPKKRSTTPRTDTTAQEGRG